MADNPHLNTGDFGACCTDLRDAMSQPPESLFRIEENGVLYLSIGYVETEQGPGFFDSAVRYCPFCGVELQTSEHIALSASS